MTEEITFHTVAGDTDNLLDLVFIHGLTGDAVETWSSDGTASESAYWPKWFAENSAIRISTLGYPASVFAKWAKKEMNLFERAKNALEYMSSYNLGEKPIAIVAHSLGGLLTKQMLRTANDGTDKGWKTLAGNVRLVAFFGTPHTGASLAGILTHMPCGGFSSTHVTTLANSNGHLEELNEAYRAYAPNNSIQTLVYYEKYKCKGMPTVLVDLASADPGVVNTSPIALDEDHLSMCKPKTKDAVAHRSLSRHINNLIKKGLEGAPPTAFGHSDYTKVTDDRRDLLQKLIDGGRESEFGIANEHQNKFAQRFYKLGLHDEARTKHDKLLSDVEQRFQLHVYQNKICKKAADDEVLAAIQTHVIDAVCQKYAGEPDISSTAVLRAIYFLTQQCHIKWDA